MIWLAHAHSIGGFIRAGRGQGKQRDTAPSDAVRGRRLTDITQFGIESIPLETGGAFSLLTRSFGPPSQRVLSHSC